MQKLLRQLARKLHLAPRRAPLPKLEGPLKTCGLVKIKFHNTKCRIISENGWRAYAGVLRGASGLFDLKRKGTEEWGRRLCRLIEERAGVRGFIALENAHLYGISGKEIEEIRKRAGAGDGDEVLLFACPFRRARKAFEVLAEELR